MISLEQRFTEFIDTLNQLGSAVTPAEATKHQQRLEALDYELRTAVPAGERYDGLLARRLTAGALVDVAILRARRGQQITQPGTDFPSLR